MKSRKLCDMSSCNDGSLFSSSLLSEKQKVLSAFIPNPKRKCLCLNKDKSSTCEVCRWRFPGRSKRRIWGFGSCASLSRTGEIKRNCSAHDVFSVTLQLPGKVRGFSYLHNRVQSLSDHMRLLRLQLCLVRDHVTPKQVNK